jgi:hypothetical protein
MEQCIKSCKIHGETEHGFYSGRWRCKKCMIEYDYNKRHRIKKLLVDYKGGKCEICGYDKCLNALDFHHLNKEDKQFTLNNANYNKSLDVLKKEADKCILVCSNCHREIHYKDNEDRRERLLCEHVGSKEHPRSKSYAQDKLNYDDVLNDFNSGLYQQEIAEKYNTSLSTVKRFMQTHNIGRKRINFNIDKITILNCCKVMPTFANISKMTGFSVKAIKKYCIENDIIDDINLYRRQIGLKDLSKKLDYI